MAENTAIEWAKNTLNFWWGCHKVSPGCLHCYAETLSVRYGHAPAVAPDAPDSDFYKIGKKAAGRLLDGREWNEHPAHTTPAI